MKKSALFFTVFISFFISQNTHSQSPWTQQKGHAYIQLGISGLFYDLAQINGHKSTLNADYSDVTTQVYADYGLTDQLEAQLILPYKFINVSSNTNSNTANLTGIGNITLGLKYKIQDKDWKISSGLQYTANSIVRNSDIEGQKLTTGFDANTYMPYVSAGTSEGKWYYFGTVGFGYMTNDFSDYLKLDAEIGYQITPNGHLIFALNSKNVVSKESAFFNNSIQWPSYLDRQTYNALGLKYNYEFKPNYLGANIAIFGAFGNDNVPLAPSINLSFYTKL
ncbi:hypothetical protein [Flavobacterium faecale]|uniref:hypothetical protein n=1 Tax=Flavobacterium faecale TaxID=1355330 RepID=UPI003AAE6B0E